MTNIFLRDFEICFTSLKRGEHRFKYEIDNAFFEYFKFTDISETKINVAVVLIKRSTLMELKMTLSGQTQLICDISLEQYFAPLNATYDLIIKFGERPMDISEPDVIYLKNSEFKMNIAQQIFESVVLSIPIKKVHPGVLDGSLKSELMDYYEINSTDQIKDKKPDYRWEKLRSISSSTS
ncbi:MAG: DUF177 domain-containing protein [Flavobacteriaceae bacterium]|nr:DUF177 domain-containing protein [Flavobacteriaceae bacterium]